MGPVFNLPLFLHFRQVENLPHGLTQTVSGNTADGRADQDGDRCTNLEEYPGSLAGDFGTGSRNK